MSVDILISGVLLLAVAGAFFVSSSAGLGGSLVLVPALALLLGTKEGVAMAALLLAANNVVKAVAYRRVLPFRASAVIMALTMVGSLGGATLLVLVPERVVTIAVILSLGSALLAERQDLRVRRTAMAPALALASGATSGVSGTSGPLKGVAIRSLTLDRFHTVGAAALVSLGGDLAKTAVFTEASLLSASSFRLAVLATPVMFGATYAGRVFNNRITEQAYQRLFWMVMGGYSVRLLTAVF